MNRLSEPQKQILPSLRRICRYGAVVFIVGVLGIFLFQNIRSAFRFYPSGLPGYQVQAFDATPRWAGTRALFARGISPYSPEGSAIIQTQYFGRPIQPGDEKYVRDQQKFAYPLHVAFLYLPTIGFSFNVVLVILGMLGAAAFVGGTWFWFLAAQFPRDLLTRIFLVAIFLLTPVIYIAIQSRQPVLWVYFFVAASVVLMLARKPQTDAAAGILLVWASIKPQSSILVIAYIVLVFYLLERGVRNSKWFLFAFGATALGLFVLNQLLLSSWISELVVSLQDYREYAGSTAAEALFQNDPFLTPFAAVLAFVVWCSMIGLTLRVKRDVQLDLLCIAYAQVLQVFVFPTHTYNFLFAFPVLLIALKAISELWLQKRWGLLLIVGLGFGVTSDVFTCPSYGECCCASWFL